MGRREGCKPLDVIAPPLPTTTTWHSSLNMVVGRCTSISPMMVSPLNNLLLIMVYIFVCLIIDCPRPNPSSDTLLFPQRVVALLCSLSVNTAARKLGRCNTAEPMHCTSPSWSMGFGSTQGQQLFAMYSSCTNRFWPISHLSSPDLTIAHPQSAEYHPDAVSGTIASVIIPPHSGTSRHVHPRTYPCRAYAPWELVQNPAICTQ